MAPDLAKKIVELAMTPGTTRDELGDSLQLLFQELNGSGRELAEEVLGILAKGIRTPNQELVIDMAMLCGALIEQGLRPEPFAAEMLPFIEEKISAAKKLYDACAAQGPQSGSAADLLAPLGVKIISADSEIPGVEPEEMDRRIAEMSKKMPAEAAAWQLMEKLYPPAVAMFCGGPALRKKAAHIRQTLSYLTNHLKGAHWIASAISVLHDEPYVALEPSTGIGVEGKMSGVVSNFQLSVLLMDEFPREPGKPRRVSEEAAAIARGEQGDAQSVEGTWNLYNHTGLTSDGKLDSNIDRRATWIWNEGKPEDIELFEGRRVILLGEPSLSRNFYSSLTFAHLPAELTMEKRLSPAEVQQWIQRILAARKS